MADLVSREATLNWPVYEWDHQTKSVVFLDVMNQLLDYHRNNCIPYDLISKRLWGSPCAAKSIDELPFLPVRLFKEKKFLSVEQNDIIKTVTSSGTSGQSVSQVHLDADTASMQVKVLSKIVTDFIGRKRLPLLVIDSKETVHDRLKFSARAAGIIGFSTFGRNVEFALDDDMSLNEDRVEAFLRSSNDSPILIFGFTSIIWGQLVKYLESRGRKLSIPNGVLIHGGGWKKLSDEAVTMADFNRRVHSATGVSKVHNYYGMAEQTGSIFVECSEGYMHASVWSEVLVRDPISFNPLPHTTPGLIQVLSLIPKSYPGNSLLTEDLGVVLGIDSCKCGRNGTFFKVLGRAEKSEIRGCSDTYSN